MFSIDTATQNSKLYAKKNLDIGVYIVTLKLIFFYVLQILEVATRKVDFLRSDMISHYKEVK